MLRWGLIPYWAKDVKIAFSTINAMAETMATKPAFREAFVQRRCIVLADGFYEWIATGAKQKQPYLIRMMEIRHGPKVLPISRPIVCSKSQKMAVLLGFLREKKPLARSGFAQRTLRCGAI
jgi:hypothetical protein